MGAQVHVEPEELAALAAELATLADALADDAEDCRASAATLYAALPGPEGWRAGGVATACATMTAALAGHAGALARTLAAALASYRGLDAALADGITDAGRVSEGPR